MSTIRSLTVDDAAALFAIEKAATAYPLSQRQILEGLVGNEFGWGIEVAGDLAGFALFNSVLDEATLLDIAVHPHFRRCGLARKLLQSALAALSARANLRCLLEVRIGNAAAIALYRSLGFHDDGRRRNYYPTIEGREDALLMSRDLRA